MLFHHPAKEPGTRKRSVWHQDQPYDCVNGRQIVVLWTPLGPRPASVSLQCVRGSHTWGKAFRPIRFRDGADFGRDADDGYMDPPDIEREYAGHILAWELEPGDVIAFHGIDRARRAGQPRAAPPARDQHHLGRRRRRLHRAPRHHGTGLR